MNAKTDPLSLLQEAAQIAHLERGKISILREGPNGPFYNHQCRENGKNVSRYVPRDQVAAVQEAIDGYARFESLIQEYVDLKVDQTRAAITADSKKRRCPRPHRPRANRRNPAADCTVPGFGCECPATGDAAARGHFQTGQRTDRPSSPRRVPIRSTRRIKPGRAC